MLAITFWVGALGLVGAIFMIAPPEIPPELGMHMPLDIRPSAPSCSSSPSAI